MVNQYFVHILSLVTDNNPSWISRREENDRRNYFMINLHESIVPDRDQTGNPCQLFMSAAFYAKCTSDYMEANTYYKPQTAP